MRLLAGAGIVAGGIIGVGSAAWARQGPEVPAAVRAQLSANYPGWRFAKTRPHLHEEAVCHIRRLTVEVDRYHMLYHHPEIYDALFRPEGHLAHYAALAERYPGAVLELACGSGQLTVPLAQHDRTVVGVDLSRPMLASAEQRAAATGVSVEFIEADMRTFSLARRFALVFIARNSLMHLGTTDDFIATFAAVRRHLAPGGVFAFDVFNPDVRMLAQPAGERAFVMRAPSEQYGELVVEATSDYDAATQVNRATWYISAPGRPDAWVTPLHLRSIFPQELPLLLAAGGFRLLSRAGDLTGAPFTSGSSRQVCVCAAVGTE